MAQLPSLCFAHYSGKCCPSYYFNGMLDKAKGWYDKLFDLKVDVEPEYYFRYSQSLKSVKDYDKADKMMEKFFELTNDYRGEMYVKNKMYLTEIVDQLDKYKIEDAGINSKDSDAHHHLGCTGDRCFID